MKKVLILITTMMTVSIATYANVPANHPKLGEYFSKRFVNLIFGTAPYHIDYNQVQAVIYDAHGQISVMYAPRNVAGITPGSWGKDAHWIFFKNGDKIIAADGNSYIKWEEYRTFLKENPQFLSIP